MPLFVTAVIAARRGGRPATVTVRLDTPPLWQMIAEEVALAARGFVARVFGRRDRQHGQADASRSPQ
jgi:hypothetical protein